MSYSIRRLKKIRSMQLHMPFRRGARASRMNLYWLDYRTD